MAELLSLSVELSPRLLPSVSKPSSTLPRRSVFGLFELSAIGLPAVLEVEPPLALALLETLSGGRPSRGPSMAMTRVERAAWGFLLLESLHALQSEPFIRQHWAPRLIAVHDFREEFIRHLPGGAWLTLDICVRAAGVEGTARMHLPAMAVQCALEATEAEQRPKSDAGLRNLVMSFSVEAGARLPIRDWARIGSGDVVMLEGIASVYSPAGTVALRSPWFELTGSLDAGMFRLHRARRRIPLNEVAMSTGPDDVTCSLPLELQVELGHAKLSLEELHGLSPGTVVPLQVNLASPVVLRLGTRAVARAELVDVDGAIGARILNLVP
jgi:type III secretion protein Q